MLAGYRLRRCWRLPARLELDQRMPTATIRPPELALPDGGGILRGLDLRVEAAAFRGAATATLPIHLPGARGFVPRLTLTYDSSGGNGPFGAGAQIALPSIARTTAMGIPTYTDADPLAYSEAGMLVAKGTWADGVWLPVERTVTDDAGGVWAVRKYSTREYGQQFVIINGGLIRTDVVQYEALAFIIAHQIGVLQGGDPKDGQDYTCRGQADYNAFLAVFPYVWFGLYSNPMVQPAIAQVTAFFDQIDPAHRGGLPGNRCNDISIDCRLEAIAAASVLKTLPQCAGGPLPATLEVTGATPGEDGTTVTIGFNAAVDVATAGLVGAYAFWPLTAAEDVTVAPDALSATVTAAFTPDTEYKVTVEDVVSADGNPLIPSKSSATFKTPATVPPVDPVR